MNPDFPAVPEEQRGTLEKLQGMETGNIWDEAYNVVPTGASCLKDTEQKSAVKKRGDIVEEVAAKAVNKQAQFYEEGKRFKKEIVEHTEVRDQTPNMPVAFINTTSRGAGQLSRKVSPAAPRPNDQHGINPEQVPHVLLKDEALLKNSCSIAELRKTDIEALQKPFKSKTSEDVSNDIGVEVNKARSDSCRLGYEECFESIMTKIHERLPYDVRYISGVQFKVRWNLELSDPSDKARFVKNFIHAKQSSKFQSGTNNNAINDQGDIANRSTSDNHDFNQLIEGNKDINHKNQSYILGNDGAIQSKEERNELKRKCNAQGCVVTDSTRDSAIVNLQHEEPIPKKKCRKESIIKYNQPDPEGDNNVKGKCPRAGKQHIRRSRRKGTVQDINVSTTECDNRSALESKNVSLKHLHKPSLLNMPNIDMITDLRANAEGEKLDHNNVLLDLGKKVLCNRANTVVANVKLDKQLPERPRYNETQEKDREQQHCGNIPIFTLIDSELLKGSAEEQKTVHERIVLKLVKNEEEWEIKKDPPDSNDYLSDGDEDMPEIQTSFEEDIMGIRTETNVPSYHYMANGVEEDDEQTLQYGFDGPFGRIIEN